MTESATGPAIPEHTPPMPAEPAPVEKKDNTKTIVIVVVAVVAVLLLLCCCGAISVTWLFNAGRGY
jgi:hypothetical protein